MNGEPAGPRREPRFARTTRQEQIRAAITDYIVDNGLPPGAPLPTEAELVDELGVGRNALRETMKVLEALGIVEIRHGFGTYVGASTLTALESGLRFRAQRSLREGLDEIRDLLDVREVLEVGLMDRAVATLDDADLATLADVVREMEQAAARGEHFPTADWRFHEGLFRPLGNHLVVDLLRVFWGVFHQIEPDLPGAIYTPAAAASWHRDILTALEARDVDDARAAMAAHFSDIRERLGR